MGSGNSTLCRSSHGMPGAPVSATRASASVSLLFRVWYSSLVITPSAVPFEPLPGRPEKYDRACPILNPRGRFLAFPSLSATRSPGRRERRDARPQCSISANVYHISSYHTFSRLLVHRYPTVARCVQSPHYWSPIWGCGVHRSPKVKVRTKALPADRRTNGAIDETTDWSQYTRCWTFAAGEGMRAPPSTPASRVAGIRRREIGPASFPESAFELVRPRSGVLIFIPVRQDDSKPAAEPSRHSWRGIGWVERSLHAQEARHRAGPAGGERHRRRTCAQRPVGRLLSGSGRGLLMLLLRCSLPHVRGVAATADPLRNEPRLVPERPMGGDGAGQRRYVRSPEPRGLADAGRAVASRRALPNEAGVGDQTAVGIRDFLQPIPDRRDRRTGNFRRLLGEAGSARDAEDKR